MRPLRLFGITWPPSLTSARTDQMAIKLTCGCGKSLSVKDEYAGRKVNCPACKMPLKVPAADEFANEEFADEPAETHRKSRTKGAKKGKKSAGSNRGLIMGATGAAGLLVTLLLVWMFGPAKPDNEANAPETGATATVEPSAVNETNTMAKVAPRPEVMPASPSPPATPPPAASSTTELSGDFPAIQGAWQVADVTLDPDDSEAAKFVALMKQGTWTIRGDVLTMSTLGISSLATIKLDPSQKTIDMTPQQGHQEGQAKLGIYSIAGDSWQLCSSKSGAVRPKEMTTEKGSGQFVVTFKRATSSVAAPAVPFDANAWQVAKEKFKAIQVDVEVEPLGYDVGFPEGLTHCVNIRLPETADGTISPELWELASSLNHILILSTYTTDATLQQLAQHPGLLALNLNGRINITPSGLESLENCSLMQNLILHSSTEPVSMELLAAISQLRQLRGLGISGCPVTGETLESIVQLSELEDLRLLRTGTSDADTTQIAKLMKLKKLTLDETKVTDAGLQSLKGLSRLTRLSIRGLSVTPQAVAEFKAALPNCEVIK
jgi:uncharacterized protein (TIGR03067 family)